MTEENGANGAIVSRLNLYEFHMIYQHVDTTPAKGCALGTFSPRKWGIDHFSLFS